ncbi:unnamed protein product [Parnassius mnemosyne]|uniref:Uncharacterized protein n=1 Tax=Parnassius mnemosyne TaxID=213953 RepID=A0AAV1L226_9NEOP
MVLASWAVLVGAALVGIVRGAHYGDYAAAEMPHYGSEEYHESAREAAPAVDDYNDRSPEAPASPDYKYEDHLNLKTVNIKTDDSGLKSTLKPSRVQRPNLRAHVDRNKVKSAFHQRKKSRNSVKKAEINEKQLRNGRIRSNDVIDKEDDFIGDDRYQDRFEDDKVYTRATTERVVRRKPRDRSFGSPEIEIENDESEDDDDEELKNEHSHVKDAEYSVTEESVALPAQSDESKHLNTNEETEAFRQQSPDDDLISRLEAKKLDQKKEDQYQDYYDMKRVNNIKKKITVLYRRTKARATGSTTSRRYQVWTYRRSYVLDRYPTATSDDDDIPTRTTTRIKSKNRNKTKTKTMSAVNFITEKKSPTITKVTTRLSATKTITTSAKSIESTTTDLSLAEKSRLSILKKAQLKEGLMDKRATVKPPVLMQVSQKMNTVVMVEPRKQNLNVNLMGSLGGPVSDSPERLARAKRLMRRKLVAGARSIHDLTDNWDEMICDYLDVAQLDGAIKKHISTSLIVLLLLLQLLF